MTGRFEFFEHTADVGIRAEGDTLADAFAAAARGLFAHIADPARIDARQAWPVTLDAADLDDLLVQWLEEVRFIGEVESVVFARFDVDLSIGKPRLTGRAWGEPYSAAKHGHMHEVKAITRHGLKVQVDPPLVEVILDI